MGAITLMLSGCVGALVALISPLVALWMGLFLWTGSATISRNIGLLMLALGFTSGALSGSFIRLGFMTFTGTEP